MAKQLRGLIRSNQKSVITLLVGFSGMVPYVALRTAVTHAGHHMDVVIADEPALVWMIEP